MTRRITVGQKVTRVTVGPQTVRVTTAQSTQTRVRVTTGTVGPQGPAGAAGPGVPAGGVLGQILTKQSATDYDADWVDPADGDGDVIGPASAVDSNLVGFDGTTGKLIKDSGVAAADAASAISASHSHTNKAQLDLVTDGGHDARIDNPHSVMAAQLSDLGSYALLRTGNDWWDGGTPTPGKYASELPFFVDFVLVESALNGHKYVCALDSFPVSAAVSTALATKANYTHTHVASSITDFSSAVAGTASVSANTSHRGLINNPHAVTAAQVGALTDAASDGNTYGRKNGAWSAITADVSSVFGRTGAVVASNNDYTWAQIDKTTSSLADITTRSHTALTDIGTNTHGQIDTHLGLTNAHIDWTNATQDFLTTGQAQVDLSTLTAKSMFFADANIPVTGVASQEFNGFDIDYDLTLAAGCIYLNTVRGIRFRYDLVNNGAAVAAPTVQIIDGRINAGAVAISDTTSPMYYSFTNPATAQGWSNGFMRVDVTGGTGTTIAFWSSANTQGAGNATGYKGFVSSVAGATGAMIGVQGYVSPSATANHSEAVCVDAAYVGGAGTAADKRMGLRANAHVLVKGSVIASTGAEATPNAVTTTHLNFLSNRGEIYAEGNVEIDGELFCDGNESHSLVETATTPYTAAAVTYIMVDATAGNKVVNLPAISGLSGNREYAVKKVDASGNTVTVTANGSDTIDGAATVVLSSQYDYVRIVAGTEWHVVG